MTTLEEHGPAADAELSAAVEAQMGKILDELGGALGVLLTALGTRSGQWAALAGAGPLTFVSLLLSPNQIGPPMTRMSAAMTPGNNSGHSSTSHPRSRMSGRHRSRSDGRPKGNGRR